MSTDNAVVLTPEQETALEEWKHLCYTLERAQGDHLVANCREKFQYAKTYLVYGREIDQIAVEIKQAASQGQFTFFSDRGIAVRHLSPTMAEQMIRVWRGAVASKRATVADMFIKRFGEDIEEFIGTPHNASRLIMALSFDQRDAILALAEWTQNKLTVSEVAQIRSEIIHLRHQVDELGKLVRQLVDRAPAGA
jgi:hypothetical protein